MGRRASGIERVTRTLFSPDALSPLPLRLIEGRGSRPALIWRQMGLLPLAAALDPRAVFVFPGYPPAPPFSLLRDRSVLYVHDLFLLTRRADLNWGASLYAAWPFARALRRFRYFFANTETTARGLSGHVASDAHVQLYRPLVSNVFGLEPGRCRSRSDLKPERPLVIGSIGTVEPRKRFLLAAEICRAFGDVLGRRVELWIIGREAWGGSFAALSEMEHVRLYGFLPDSAARDVINRFDALLCSSEDEGLCLPLLEVQHGGVPVVAPDLPVFREVLGPSGFLFQPQDVRSAVLVMERLFRRDHEEARLASAAIENVRAWNARADADHDRAISFLAWLLERTGGAERGSSCTS